DPPAPRPPDAHGGVRPIPARGRPGHARAHPAPRALDGPGVARPGLLDGAGRRAARLPRVRHPLRRGRRHAPEAADGRGPRDERRRPRLDHPAARGPALPRRGAGARPRLRREPGALEPARHLRPRFRGRRGPLRDARRPDAAHPPQAPVPAPAGRHRQAALLARLHHARAPGQDLPHRGGHGDGRLGPLPVPARRARLRQPRRLRALRRLRAAGRNAGMDLRRQGGALRPRRVARHRRQVHRGLGAAAGRGRLDREHPSRPGAAGGAQPARPRPGRRPARHGARAALQPRRRALQQRGAAPLRHAGRATDRLPRHGDRRRQAGAARVPRHVPMPDPRRGRDRTGRVRQPGRRPRTHAGRAARHRLRGREGGHPQPGGQPGPGAAGPGHRGPAEARGPERGPPGHGLGHAAAAAELQGRAGRGRLGHLPQHLAEHRHRQPRAEHDHPWGGRGRLAGLVRERRNGAADRGVAGRVGGGGAGAAGRRRPRARLARGADAPPRRLLPPHRPPGRADGRARRLRPLSLECPPRL
ncbi:MAG: ABC transporter, substrate-binding protein (cluster 5, nickel/peptides/opines), partial [uncultured Acetobacteraceae bacterium]